LKTITIIGLGPGPKKLLTLEAYELLNNINEVHFRTIEHPVAKELIDEGIRYKSFDDLYDQYENFDELYQAIAADLIKTAKNEGKVFYAVPGHSNLYDESVKYIYNLADEAIEIKTIYGASVHEVALNAINASVTDDLLVTNALDVKKHRIDYKKNNLVIGVFNQYIASDLKVNLMNAYDLSHQIYYIHGAETENESVALIDLEDLDRQVDYNHLTCIYIPKLTIKKDFSDLIEIMDFLRSEDGCPWDRKQTNKSLMPYTIEEVYELIETIEADDFEAFEEELGDLLLQVVFYAQINAEEGYFSIDDVINQIVEKLIRRHPHLFNNEIEADGDPHKNWDDLKKKEYDEKFIYEGMARIPNSLPSLMVAYKIQKKAADHGFDWENIDGAYDKLNEEIIELKDAVAKGNPKEIVMELGDLLFSVVNVSRFLDVRPELALRQSNKKFIQRFRSMEEKSRENNVVFSELDIENMEKLWNLSKK
jgi:tetrapyrrole methylase family protein/MazG family protein